MPGEGELIGIRIFGDGLKAEGQPLSNVKVMHEALTAEIPNWLSDAPNQTVEIEVQKGVYKSNKFPFTYKRTEEIVEIYYYYGTPVVSVKQCGKDSNKYACNGVADVGGGVGGGIDAPGCKWLNIPGTNKINFRVIAGGHSNNWAAWGNDSGTDIYEIKLKNGWVIDHATIEKNSTSSDEKISATPVSDAVGKSTWSPRINWTVTPNDSINYCYRVWIRGPKGVSYYE